MSEQTATTTTASPIEYADHLTISIGVRDLDKAIDWYREELQTEGTTPVFGVKDIEAARSHLESNGVRFDGETQVIPEMVKLATFYDPDGNPWMLAESSMPHTA
jgi:uncharacterized glyoxalase superfamily protein PhnB